MPKRRYIQVCENEGCDYLPCIDERIFRLEEAGLDASELLTYRDEVRAAEGRLWAAEGEWLAALDANRA